MQVNKFSGYYVHLTVNPKYFDWNGFVAAVNNYHGGDLFPVPIQSPKKSGVTLQHGIIPGSEVVQISSDTSPGDNEALAVRGAADVALSTILNWMIYILHDVLEIAVNVQELRATVYNTFTNLKWASSSGFADFSSSSSGSNSSWEYRTVYAYPKPGDPTKFLSMVTTIKLEANITTQSSWWGLVSSTTARFYANITAMKLSVTKGFKSPV
ncbi:delta-endotoxin CytB [Neolentinus lepideus HHB14362 ss-1]|uniref:Delta-endotoxin CytB n=1 Tax=Neolentinus lepideus HHB14362 ss-1 TaxID=1314782 RepID=A0A165TTM9_9AGAM|nr:delta-endotoxin CytB [Neolentinus lepideus HHB14362 ss-1]